MTTSVTNSSTVTNPYAILNGTSASSSTSSGSTVSPTSAQGIENQFLTLLTTQLQSQDPTNPMDNSAITSQMAQISQVTGMQNLNQTMQSLLSSQLSSQSLMAAGTIGGQALVSGNSLTWGGSGSAGVGAGVSLASAASQMAVTVKNAAGQTVDTINVSNPTSGMNTFTWDGTDGNGNVEPAGNYTFSATATATGTNGSATAVTATPYANQTIKAVSWDSSGNPQLVLSGGQTVAMSAVQQIS